MSGNSATAIRAAKAPISACLVHTALRRGTSRFSLTPALQLEAGLEPPATSNAARLVPGLCFGAICGLTQREGSKERAQWEADALRLAAGQDEGPALCALPRTAPHCPAGPLSGQRYRTLTRVPRQELQYSDNISRKINRTVNLPRRHFTLVESKSLDFFEPAPGVGEKADVIIVNDDTEIEEVADEEKTLV